MMAGMTALPAPFSLVNPIGRSDLLLTCDHAGSFIPPALNGLGLPASFEDPDQHLNAVYDVGAADLTRALASRLRAPAVLSTISRLVVECNRWPYDPEFVAPRVQGVLEIAGNQDLTRAEIAERAQAWFWPYHQAITRQLGRSLLHGVRPALISVHSFTAKFHGQQRPWQIGVLWDQDFGLREPMLTQLSRVTDWVVGDNQPYDIRGGIGFGVSFHPIPMALPNVVLEVRSDQIDTPAKADAFAAILAPCIEGALAALPTPSTESLSPLP
ncbi:MAG: N-formylglutamate amidohydrolase [Alphaproteobacteria bacterium]|nr:N-formylglutamate amidohydrolase [Alphaproteobacteria bacterium]